MPNIFDCIIIGGGPSGMTAALNILRGGKTCLIIERESFGGQIATSPRVENIPSIKSISGLEFSNNLFDQISDLGVEFELDEVISVSKKENIFIVKTNYNEYISHTIVIASGLVHRKTGLAKEEDFIGHGVSYCATCDGSFYKDKEIFLIGDANTAIQYALLLTNYCKFVHIYALFDRLFADDILIKALQSKNNYDVTYNSSLIEFIGDKELKALKFVNTSTKEEFTVKAEGVFIAIGQVADNDRYSNLVTLDANGFIIVNEGMETSTPGVYAVGDCTKKAVRQVQTACNDGAIAAFNILKYLN